MTKKETLKLFEERKVRTVWDDEKEKWYFSIVDVVSVLTDSVDATAYWRKLKQRLKEEGNETVTNCHGLKMKAADGKMRLTDVADTEQLLRIIQSIPSPGTSHRNHRKIKEIIFLIINHLSISYFLYFCHILPIFRYSVHF